MIEPVSTASFVAALSGNTNLLSLTAVLTTEFFKLCHDMFQEVKLLADGIVAAPLQELTLSRLDLSHGNAKRLGETLGKGCALRTLDLSVNQLGPEDAKALSEGLKQNGLLTALNLRDNSLGCKGAEAIAEALWVHRALTALDLGSNYLGAKGAEYLGPSVKATRTLKTLGLSRNLLGAGAHTPITRGLSTNQSITCVDLSLNFFTDDDMVAVAEMLTTNRSLVKLDLSSNVIGTGGSGDGGACSAKLMAALRRNERLTTLNLSPDPKHTLYRCAGCGMRQCISDCPPAPRRHRPPAAAFALLERGAVGDPAQSGLFAPKIAPLAPDDKWLVRARALRTDLPRRLSKGGLGKAQSLKWL